jgi:hypothetical protein
MGAVTTDMMRFQPLFVGVNMTSPNPVPAPFCAVTATSLPPNVKPVPPPGSSPTAWPENQRFCLYPYWETPFFWNLPWQCCLFDWCIPLYTMFPFPATKPKECDGLDWCDDWPWNKIRSSSSTPSTTYTGPYIS